MSRARRSADGDGTASHDRVAVRARLSRDLAMHGVTDPKVVDAMVEVRRERFVAPDLAEVAYEDRPLSIGSGQTISQPAMVAIMAEAAELGPNDRVLEIGTGSGYGAAVLATLAAEVWTIERIQALADEAIEHLEREEFDQVHVRVGDGTLGWPEEAPFDAIVVTAAGPEVPQALIDQLADGGRLIMPVGPDTGVQSLVRVRRAGSTTSTEDLGAVRFVPLIGEQGWARRRWRRGWG